MRAGKRYPCLDFIAFRVAERPCRSFLAPPAPGVQKAAVAALILVLLVASYLTRHAPAAAEAMPAVADAGVEAV